MLARCALRGRLGSTYLGCRHGILRLDEGVDGLPIYRHDPRLMNAR